MSRGPVPARAREGAVLIAGHRGIVHSHLHRRENLCDLSIVSPGIVAFVSAMRLVKLSSTVEDILHDFAAAIARLRLIVSALAVSRELWLRTPRGVWRFFRILDDRIIELDRLGKPLANGTGPAVLPAAGTGLKPAPEPPGNNGKKTLTTTRSSAGNTAEPGKNPVPAVPANDPGQPGASAPDVSPAREQAKDLIPAAIPEKPSGPEKDPGPVRELPPGPDVETMPEPVKKFLKRRVKGLSDPGPD